jgi:hypothetical protein
VQRFLWAQYKPPKHCCHHITRNALWKSAVWFIWPRSCVPELCQQLTHAGMCNWGLVWMFVERFCNLLLWPPHTRIASMCLSLSRRILIKLCMLFRNCKMESNHTVFRNTFNSFF